MITDATTTHFRRWKCRTSTGGRTDPLLRQPCISHGAWIHLHGEGGGVWKIPIGDSILKREVPEILLNSSFLGAFCHQVD